MVVGSCLDDRAFNTVCHRGLSVPRLGGVGTQGVSLVVGRSVRSNFSSDQASVLSDSSGAVVSWACQGGGRRCRGAQ